MPIIITSAPTSPPTTFSPTSAPTTFSPTSAPTTFSPTSAPTTFSPTSAPTTFSPTSAPTTTPPTTTAPPGTGGLSPNGMVNVNVCIAGNTAQVTLEGLTTQSAAWNGSSFSAVVFPAFNTAANAYPAYTVSGQTVGSDLQVTVANGSNQSVFNLPSGGSGGCAT